MTPRKQILTIVRRALDRGQTVEIDGLGVLRATFRGYELAPQARPQVFIAYVEEDLPLARRLCDGIAAAGFVPWLERLRALPGRWSDSERELKDKRISLEGVFRWSGNVLLRALQIGLDTRGQATRQPSRPRRYENSGAPPSRG